MRVFLLHGYGLARLQVLGTVMGFTAWEYMTLIESGQVTLKENIGAAALLSQVLKGRIDGAYTEIAVATHQLATILKQPDALVFDADLPHMQDFYYLSTTKHPDIIQEFNAFLTEERETIQALKRKYMLYPDVE